MPRGVYDRSGTTRSANGKKAIDPDSLLFKLNSWKALAAQADKLAAKAKLLRKRADEAAMQAGDARDQLAERMRELSI